MKSNQVNHEDIIAAIVAAANDISSSGPLSDRYNVFVGEDGDVSLEPVVGVYGAGTPAQPEKYIFFLLNVYLTHLQDEDYVREMLSDF